ncbi:MAG: hypothetical protein NDI77_14270 [Geobacteraceae bacterium]|nr:hypothetical protein [Geobacteraceae bacterium]
MAKRILFILTLLLLDSFGPAFLPVVASFVPITAAAAWAEAEGNAAAPSSPAAAGAERVVPEGTQAPPEEAESGEEPEQLGETLEDVLEDSEAAIDQTHARISRGIFTMATWLDSFFGDERSESEIQKSRLRLGVSALIKEREGVRFDVRPNFRLDLPLLKDRLHLLLEGEEEETEFQSATLQEVRQQFINTPGENFSASLRYFFESTKERNISVRLGIRFPDAVPALLVEPRYRQSRAFDSWLLRFTQRLITLSNYTMEVRTTFDLDRVLSDKLFLRCTADGSWFSERHGYFYDLRAALFHRLSPRRVLEYQWNNFFQTSPSHNLEEIRLRVLYRQQFWREWLYYEVGPQLTFPRGRDYKYTPGIFLRLEAIFGAYWTVR